MGYNEREEQVFERTCSEQDCRRPFTITDNEVKWYRSKGMSEPKRCKPCREKRKAQQNNHAHQDRHY